MAMDKTRRELIQDSALLATAAAVGLTSPSVLAAKVKGFEEYRSYDALGLAELVRKGDASADELLDLAMARAEAVNPKINAIVMRHDELARQAIKQGLPQGPFSGVPWLLKDLGVSMDGTITTEGSVLFKDAMRDHDSTLVKRYREAGLVIFGKTASPEFGGTATTESAIFGDTHNPWDLQRSSGGSSGGAAAAVAAGIIPAAHASDGGGSIRIPASACGLFGMKPTRGRVPMGPDIYETRNGLSVQHAISRSVRDSAALLDAVQGPAVGDAYAAPTRQRPYLQELGQDPGKLRIALMTQSLFPLPVAPECVAAAENAAKLCASLGHEVEEAMPTVDLEEYGAALGISSNVLSAKKVGQREKALGRKARQDELEPITWRSVETGRQISGVMDSEARDAGHKVCRSLGAFMEKYDVVLSPTMALVPPLLGAMSLRQDYDVFLPVASAASAFTGLYNVTGQPAMSVPLHWTDAGIPIGVMFTGRFGDEATLYRLAAQLEQQAPWFDKLPPI
ncbi:MAG: amidase [Halioglobus sp.]|nr:amidase [Halioglobus sp.]